MQCDGIKNNPVNDVQWIHIDKIEPNDYNPNNVAGTEMRLLYLSIKNDGYTQPIVTMFDKEKGKYIIIDGFHRYNVMKLNQDIFNRTNGLLPIVILDKDINSYMASTVRHNRARGKHEINGMSNIVFKLLRNGWTDEMICNELGMDAEEILRLKHITGFSKLFKKTKYKKAWETRKMIKLRKDHNINI